MFASDTVSVARLSVSLASCLFVSSVLVDTLTSGLFMSYMKFFISTFLVEVLETSEGDSLAIFDASASFSLT